MNVEVNYLAVVLAMFSSMIIGAIWYAPKVLGNTWMKLANIDMSKGNRNDVWKPILVTAVMSLITAYILAHVAFLSHHFFGHSFLQDAVTTAFWMWLGFTGTRIIVHDIFEGRRKKLTLLTIANEFVIIMVMGLIIGTMGVK